jgi:hypothetical protein
MGEGSRLVITEGAADPVADIDAAEWSRRIRGSGDTTCNKDATINALSHILSPRTL